MTGTNTKQKHKQTLKIRVQDIDSVVKKLLGVFCGGPGTARTKLICWKLIMNIMLQKYLRDHGCFGIVFSEYF